MQKYTLISRKIRRKNYEIQHENNNKMMIGRFNTEQLEDIYIINMHKMTSTYNWAARGFVTYYDSDGNLVTEYSNQINIIDMQNADEIK